MVRKNKNCVFSMEIDGKEKVFNTDRELDTFLLLHQHEIGEIGKTHRTFQTDPFAITMAALDSARIEFDETKVEVFRDATDPEEVEIIYKVPGSKGVTELIRDLGRLYKTKEGNAVNLSSFPTPFDQPRFEDDLLVKYLRDGMTLKEAEEKVKQRVDSWPEVTAYGTEIHKLYESIINNKKFTPKKLSNEQVTSLTTQFNNFLQDIKLEMGDVEIISEFRLKSKKLSPIIKTLFEEQGIDSINGAIDLLIISKTTGETRMYDFKTSAKEVGDWNQKQNKFIAENEYPSTKKEVINHQFAFYRNMLMQYGITNIKPYVIPIVLDIERGADGFSVEKLNTATMQPSVDISTSAFTGALSTKVDRYVSPYGFVNDSVIPDKLQATSEYLNQILPTAKGLSFKIRQFEADYEFYRYSDFVQRTKEGTPLFEEGYRYYFYEKGINDKVMVKCRTEAELEEYLRDFVSRLNHAKSNELIILSHNIMDMMNGKISIEEIGSNMNDRGKTFLMNNLRKFKENGWQFESNNDLNSAGFFIFRKNENVEILMMTNQSVYNQNSLGLSQSILGEYIRKRDWDNRRVLSASNGNLEIFKALAFIAKNPDAFEGTKITSIKAMNPWQGQLVPSINSQLLDNWDLLLSKKKLPNTLDKRLFRDDVSSYLSIAEDLSNMVGIEIRGFEVTPNLAQADNAKQEIEKMLNILRNKYPELYDIKNFKAGDDLWHLYVVLYRALLSMSGYRTHAEIDPGEWFNGGLNIVGLMVSSIQTSPSSNMRELGDLVNDYTAAIGEDFLKARIPVDLALEAFYKEVGVSKLIGGEVDKFKSWFEDMDNLILKDPNHPDFNGSPAARKALDMVLTTLANLRGWTDPGVIEEKKNSGEYYWLPLIEAKFVRQSKQLGVWQAIVNKYKEIKNPVENIFVGELEEKQKYEREHLEVYNRFDITDPAVRRQKIQDHGAGFYDINVERIFHEAALSYIRQAKSRIFIPNIVGMKLSLAFQEEVEGNNLAETRKALDKYIKKKIYGEPIVAQHLLPMHEFIGVIKYGFSKLSLGLNSRAFWREIFQGGFIGMSRAAVKRIDGVDVETYSKAWSYVVQNSKDNLEVAGLVRLMGATYRMSNQSLNEMANQARINWLGIRNWNENTLFLTSTSPDFLHRTTILIAKMMADGSFNAHSVDTETGELNYDWKKDKRFEIYAKGEKTHKDYLHQKTLYLKNLTEWQEKGYQLSEGDALPRAYTVREARTFKNWGDLLYGHYDAESRALMNDTFLGSIFMQYRTFITAKLEQWGIGAGIYNMEQLKLQLDEESGEEIWEIAIYPGENNTGIPWSKHVKRSEVTEEQIEQGLAKPYYAWEGDPIEGMANSVIRFAKSMATMNEEEFKRIWQDPFERKNLILAFGDMAVMMILAFIIKALYGEDTVKDMNNQPWLTQWSYNVAIGATQDGPINKVIASVFGDLNPPVYSSVSRLWNSMNSFVHGDSNVGRVVTQNVGALRELQGYFKPE